MFFFGGGASSKIELFESGRCSIQISLLDIYIYTFLARFSSGVANRNQPNQPIGQASLLGEEDLSQNQQKVCSNNEHVFTWVNDNVSDPETKIAATKH